MKDINISSTFIDSHQMEEVEVEVEDLHFARSKSSTSTSMYYLNI